MGLLSLLFSLSRAAEPERPAAGAAAVPDADAVSVDAPAGVQEAEATTKAWARQHIILAYALIWIIYFVDATQQGMATGLIPYVTSAFGKHSLTATTGIVSQLLGGLCKLPLARMLDIWGRPQGFALTTGLLTVGLVMMAACNNVQTFAAAQVFYWVGYNGMNYSLTVFIADTSALKNRGLMIAFLSSPFIITAWISGPIASSFLYGAGWRWAFGTFAIVTPLVSLPLVALFVAESHRARALGLMPQPARRPVRRSPLRSAYHHVEFDLAGLLPLTTGLALFLLPFSLYSYQHAKWRSPLFIAMVVGGLTLAAFVLFEKHVAPVQFLPYRLLVDRTIMGAMSLATTIFAAYFIWDNYFSSFLQVVNGLTLTQATYVGKIHSVGSCFWGLVVGLLVRLTGRFRWLALYFGVPLTVLASGLMVHFRQPHVPVGYVIICQIFIAFAGGTIAICEQMAVMATITHQHIAVVLAVQSMFSSVGAAIGSTIAAALWTQIFPNKLAELLPPESQSNLTSIYRSLKVQLQYPVGSPTREAISQAYGETQKMMLVTALCILSIAIISVAAWRDIHVKDLKQVKGLVV